MLDTCRVGRYGDATRGGIPQWLAQPRAELRDRHVVLVDDIYDEGVTLEFLARHCQQAGARRVTTVVLVRKRHHGRLPVVQPDLVGLEVGDEYVFGCGMDYQGHWRHLPDIWGLLERELSMRLGIMAARARRGFCRRQPVRPVAAGSGALGCDVGAPLQRRARRRPRGDLSCAPRRA